MGVCAVISVTTATCMVFFFIPGIRNQSSGQVCGVKLDAGAVFKALYYVPHLLPLAFRKVFLMPFSFFIKLW